MVKFKQNQIFIFTIFVLSWVIFGWNTGNADYDTYLKIYDNINNIHVFKSVEVGFAYSMNICYLLGLSYNTFLKIYSFIGLFIIYRSTKYFTKNNPIAILLYFIYPFLIDLIQIRNFMSFAIILFGIRFLLNDSWKSRIKFIITVVIASCFHFTSFYYLILLLTSLKKIRHIIFSTIIIFQMIIIFPKILLFLIKHFNFLEKYKVYFITESRPYLFFLFLIYFSIILIIAFISNNIVQNLPLQKNEHIKCFGSLVVKIDILLFTSLPLILLNVNFYRLQRNVLILNYILFSIIDNKYLYKKNLNIFLIRWVLVILVVLSNFVHIKFILDALRQNFIFTLL